MERTSLNFLNNWLVSSDRKPLVIRGARQVGKTWLVRHFAQANKLNLIEINFEKRPQLASLFSSNDPRQILLNLSTLSGSIDPKKSLLFLDEIQVAPELLAKLRWFAEDMPDLPIICAGSLLEFVLANHTFSMPVGRINYMHLEPLSFEEFLLAQNKPGLSDYIEQYQWQTVMPIDIHEQLILSFKEYIIIGGMPQAVNNWVKNHSFSTIRQIHTDLLATYRDDFAKYSGRLSQERLEEVMLAVPALLGEKFVYSKVNAAVQAAAVKKSLDLLSMARICHKIISSAANGIPLGAEAHDKNMKVILLDIGLCSTALGLALDQINSVDEINLIRKGGISEQVVGQLLRTITPPYIEPKLYYWHRAEKGSNAEIDYVIQYKNKIIPIEVKSGSSGSLKSLHLFMDLKQLNLAVRINSDIPSMTDVQVKNSEGKLINYQLLSLPFYLLGQLERLLNIYYIQAP